MARNPVTVSLPPFRGVTRRLVLTIALMYLASLALALISPSTEGTIRELLVLHPEQVRRGCVWQFFSYPFINIGLLSALVACLSAWFFGAVLEQERGGKWLMEYFLVSTAGGGALLCLLSFTVFRNNHHGLEPTSGVYGIWGGVLAMVLAYAFFHPEQELSFNFLFHVKAKYLIAVYLLIYLAMALANQAPLHAVAVLCAAAAGYLFLRMGPHHGVRHAFSERWYGLRNAYYRRKRQQAAKKFTVYMKKQGRDVNIDANGKYIPLDEKRDPNDRRWMN